MKLTEHIYKTSGVEYGTNSNTFLVDCGERMIVFDSGFDTVQWERIRSCIEKWGLAGKPVTHAFITHGHYDHAGNITRLNEQGTIVIAADPDAEKVENGYPEMEQLFVRPWVCGKVDLRPYDGQVFAFENGVRVTALAAPGHSEGSFAYVAEADSVRALVTGDMFFIRPLPPEDAVEVELAFMGGQDFSMPKYADTLKKMSGLSCDLLLPGHYYTYFGDVNELCRKAYELTGNIRK